MEICFENKKMKTFVEAFRQTKRVQESVEAVVPDTNEDIGRIVSVRTGVMLKSKDATANGITVSGEATALIVYITENEDEISYVELTKSFSIDYDCPGCDEALAHIALSVSNAEARVMNPRKVSVVFEICGELRCHREQETVLRSYLPESVPGLHIKSEKHDTVLHTAVCEKTLAVSEQFAFPAGKSDPAFIIYKQAQLIPGETQTIGSKLILKGNMALTVYTLSEGENYPVKSEFSAPFSQIIDTGCENIDSCTVTMVPTAVYCDLMDTINGEKAIDLELHAVTQAVCGCKISVESVSDAYSNLMPIVCCREIMELCTSYEQRTVSVSAKERLTVSEDCVDVLCVFSSLLQPEIRQGKASANAIVDILYKKTDGGISSVHRTLALTADCGNCCRLSSACITDAYFRPDGTFLDVRLSAEFCCVSEDRTGISSVTSVGLDEENAFDVSAFPSLTAVRNEGEDFWELAKEYHSTPERITEMNCGEAAERKMLFIPKAL